MRNANNLPTGQDVKRQPTLTTERLVLRPFEESDIPEVAPLADDEEISKNTLLIPHPYQEVHARRWIAVHGREYRSGKSVVFAVTLAATGALVGAVGLTIAREHRHAGLGYWIGRQYWGGGLATEAARAVLAYAFGELDLVRIHAGHFADNPASGRVMQKIGMKEEGRLRRHIFRWGEYRDMVLFGIVKEEWHAGVEKQKGKTPRGL